MAAYFVYCSNEGTRSRRFTVEFLDGSCRQDLGRFSIPASLDMETLETRRRFMREVENLAFKRNHVTDEWPVILDLSGILRCWEGKSWMV